MPSLLCNIASSRETMSTVLVGGRSCSIQGRTDEEGKVRPRGIRSTHTSRAVAGTPDAAAVRRVKLPGPINSVFPVLCHSMYESVKEECNQWALSLFDPAAGQDLEPIRSAYMAGLYPLFAACCYPSTHVTADRLILLIKLISWLFVLDDTIDESDPRTAAQIATAFQEVVTSTPSFPGRRPSYYTASGSNSKDAHISRFMERLRTEVWEEMCRGMSPHLHGRIVAEIMRSLEAQKKMSRLRHQHRIAGSHLMNTNEMVDLRVVDGFAWPMILLVEYALGFDRPDVAGNTPIGQLVGKVLAAAAKQLIMENDFISAAKELVNMDALSVVGCELGNQASTNMQGILRKSWGMAQEQERICAHLLHQIRCHALEGPPSEAKRRSLIYADAIGSLISGNLYWSTRTGRYHGADPIPWNTSPSYLAIPNAPYTPLNVLTHCL